MTEREIGPLTRCFVTGGMGFIGSHLVDRLWERGCSVTVFDIAADPARWWRDAPRGRVELVRGDLRDADALDRALPGHHVVFHLGAFTDTRTSAEDRAADLQHGTVATWTLLEAMERADVRDLVFTSSQLVYGARAGVLREDTGPLLPASPYGASKAACEALVSAYVHLFGLRAVVLRLGNVVGGRMRRGIVRDFIQRLLENPERLEVLGDGRQARTYLLVDDLVEAALAAHARAPGEGYHLYNVANGDPITATEVARVVVEEMGLDGVTEVAAAGGTRGWAGDVPTLRPDTSRIRAVGWSPGLPSAAAVREAVRRLQRDVAAEFMARQTRPLVQLGTVPLVRGAA